MLGSEKRNSVKFVGDEKKKKSLRNPWGGTTSCATKGDFNWASLTGVFCIFQPPSPTCQPCWRAQRMRTKMAAMDGYFQSLAQCPTAEGLCHLSQNNELFWFLSLLLGWSLQTESKTSWNIGFVWLTQWLSSRAMDHRLVPQFESGEGKLDKCFKEATIQQPEFLFCPICSPLKITSDTIHLQLPLSPWGFYFYICYLCPIGAVTVIYQAVRYCLSFAIAFFPNITFLKCPN